MTIKLDIWRKNNIFYNCLSLTKILVCIFNSKNILWTLNIYFTTLNFAYNLATWSQPTVDFKNLCKTGGLQIKWQMALVCSPAMRWLASFSIELSFLLLRRRLNKVRLVMNLGAIEIWRPTNNPWRGSSFRNVFKWRLDDMCSILSATLHHIDDRFGWGKGGFRGRWKDI